MVEGLVGRLLQRHVPCKWGGRVKGHMENGWGVIGKEYVVVCMEVKNEPKYSKNKQTNKQSGVRSSQDPGKKVIWVR